MAESVNHVHITEEDIKEAERLEMNPDMIMRLVDLIFMERDNNIPS